MKKSQFKILVKEVLKEIVKKIGGGADRFDTPPNTPDEVIQMLRNIIARARINGYSPSNLELDYSQENDGGIPTWWIISVGNEHMTFDNYMKGWLYGGDNQELDNDQKINKAIANMVKQFKKQRVKDPSREEMLEFIKSVLGGSIGDEFKDTVELAIYWFAHDYHGGQSTNLYSAASTSPYRPGLLKRSVEDEEDGMAVHLYKALENEFTT